MGPGVERLRDFLLGFEQCAQSVPISAVGQMRRLLSFALLELGFMLWVAVAAARMRIPLGEIVSMKD